MMAQSWAEGTKDTYNYGQYLNQLPPNKIKLIPEFERIQKKICRHKMSIMFNEICINEEMPPKYTYSHIYTHILEHTHTHTHTHAFARANTHTHTHIYIYLLNTLTGGKSCLVAPGVALPPGATKTVWSPWLAADEGRVSHVFSHVV